jgi:hypothetical protein
MRRLKDPALRFALFAGLLGFALAAFSPAIFNDADTYWHIRSGEWMLDHHAVLRIDVFSYTRLGAPWDAQEWLSEILTALAWRGGGWAGLHILFGAAFGTTAAIVGFGLRKRVDLVPALLATLLGLACVSASLLARPHLLALPLLAVWTLGLVGARERGTAPSWWLLLAMPLWANLHATFAFGLALAAALGIEAVITQDDKRDAARGWGLFIAAGAAVCLLNPQGLNGLLFPLHMMTMKGLGHIGEWAPSDLTRITPFTIALLVLAGLLVTRKLKLPPIRLLIVVGLVLLAILHSRHQMLLGICAPLLLAPFLAQAWPAKESKANAFTGPIALALIFAALLARIALPVSRGDDAVTPATALAHVSASLRALPVLNDYAFGGYLIWSGVKPFIDSRADLYGDASLANYAAITAPDKNALAASLAANHVRWTIFAADAPLVKMLDATPGWHRLYSDKFAVVQVRDE